MRNSSRELNAYRQASARFTLTLPSSASLHIWVYQVSPAASTAIWSNTLLGIDQLTALLLSSAKCLKYIAADPMILPQSLYPISPSAWTFCLLWSIHDYRRSPIKKHILSVEVSQQSYKVPRWNLFPNATQTYQEGRVLWAGAHTTVRTFPLSDLQSHRGDPLILQGELQHSGSQPGGLWISLDACDIAHPGQLRKRRVFSPSPGFWFQTQ